MVSRREERLTEREMWSPRERNGLQKGRCGLHERGTAVKKRKCGLQERETAFRKGDVVSRREERLAEREMWSPGERNGFQKGKCGLQKRETTFQKGRCGLQERGTACRKGDVVSRREERLSVREMRSPGERNGLQKGRCGFQERETAYRKQCSGLLSFFAFYFLKVYLHHSSKIKSHKRSHKTVEINVFLTILA